MRWLSERVRKNSTMSLFKVNQMEIRRRGKRIIHCKHITKIQN